MTHVQNEENSDMLPAVSAPVFESTAAMSLKL
ncbi:hypothetical protein SAFG77S_02787 [Streptomyces afghaniensis]